MKAICADLADEHQALEAVLGHAARADWDRPTPAEGWAVRDQISHLAFFDAAAVRAVRHPEDFVAESEAVLADPGAADLMGAHLAKGRAMEPDELLEWWRGGRVEMIEAFSGLDPKARIAWYGPSMGALSFATARLMETWAHGQDVADALGAAHPASARLRHVAHIGVRTMAFSYALRGLEVPRVGIRVDLEPPPAAGVDAPWVWGEGGTESVSGPALDFCLVVTQRRHLADVNLDIQGDEAARWMSIAQAFAGPPGPGRSPGQPD
ncbi:MAG: TIGR03084 family metal-binding protein [Acidimicrobiales bacterium]